MLQCTSPQWGPGSCGPSLKKLWRGVYRPHHGEKCQPHVIAGKISLERELRVHNLTMILLIHCGLVMFLNKVGENSLECLWRGRRRRQCPYCLLTKIILKCTLAKLMAWNLFSFQFRPDAQHVPLCSPVLNCMYTQKLLCWAHFTTERRKNCWMFEKLIDKDFPPPPELLNAFSTASL